MIRHLFTVTAAISLLLGVATAVLWVIGDVTGLAIKWTRMDSSKTFQTEYIGRVSGGGFEFEKSAYSPDPSDLGWHLLDNFNDYPDPDRTWRIDVLENGPFHLVFPCWSVLLLSSLLPVWWAIRARAKPAMNRSKCSNCGYNLTGNLSGVCPECGTKLPTNPEAVT